MCKKEEKKVIKRGKIAVVPKLFHIHVCEEEDRKRGWRQILDGKTRTRNKFRYTVGGTVLG